MSGVAIYVLRRLLLVPVILLIVSIVTFALGRLAPSDYVEIQAGSRARPETIERIREERGLNDPIPVQYVRWLGDVLQGDFGESVVYRGAKVNDVIFERLQVTIQYNIVVLSDWTDGAVPVDPGAHVVTANAPGRASWSTKVTLKEEGTTTKVIVPSLAAK